MHVCFLVWLENIKYPLKRTLEEEKIPNQIKKTYLASTKFAGKFTSSRSTTRHYKSVAAFLSEPN